MAILSDEIFSFSHDGEFCYCSDFVYCQSESFLIFTKVFGGRKMNTLLIEQKIELLDRKFNYLNNTLQETFLTDLAHFLEFVQEDEIISQALIRLKESYEKTALIFKKHFHDECQYIDEVVKEMQILLSNSQEITEIAGKIDALEDRLDETVLPQTLMDRFDGYLSLQPYFQSGNILYQLSAKLGYGKTNIQTNDDKRNEVRTSLDKRISTHLLLCESWKQFYSVSPVTALGDLAFLINSAFPQFLSIHAMTLLRPTELEVICDRNDRRFSRTTEDADWLRDIFHEKPNSEKKIKLVKRKAERIYESLRQELGAVRLQWQLLKNYQVRSHYYSRNYLKELATTESGKSEEVLSNDLAIYLFDQGIPVWYRVKRGNVEYDFVHPPGFKNPLLMEVKVYKTNSDAKSYILSGFRQIHSYLSKWESESNSSEGYYIVYRLGGPFLEIPKKISTPKFTIYTVFIDLADSSISGSKQKENKQITEKEILKELGCLDV